jgi:hypothetical protein
MVRKDRGGRIRVSSCGWVAFVPFVGEAQRPTPGAAPVWGSRLDPRCREPLGGRFQSGTPAP